MALWAGSWILLLVLGTLVHQTIWVPAMEGVEHGAWQRSLLNIYHMAVAPGYVAVRVVAGHWGSGELGFSLLVNAMSWGLWLCMLALVLNIRRVLLQLSWRGESGGAGVRRLFGAPDASRRRFLVDGSLAVAAAVPAAGLTRAALVDPWDLRVRRYKVPIAGLPAPFDGMRLVQLSDTHLGPRIPAEYLRRVVARAVQLRADTYLLTGDYIHAGDAYIDKFARIFEPLISAAPVAGVLGNHDWYGDGPAVSRALEAIGVRMIDNGRAFLSASGTLSGRVMDGRSICIAGVGDLLEDHVDAEAALADVPPAMPRLLLSHNPDVAEMPGWRAPGVHRVDLMLSGHTHGGQVRIPFLGTPAIPSRYGQKYAGGLVRGPAFPVLISRGIGMSILPVRFNVPPEIVEITLVSAD